MWYWRLESEGLHQLIMGPRGNGLPGAKHFCGVGDVIQHLEPVGKCTRWSLLHHCLQCLKESLGLTALSLSVQAVLQYLIRYLFAKTLVSLHTNVSLPPISTSVSSEENPWRIINSVYRSALLHFCESTIKTPLQNGDPIISMIVISVQFIALAPTNFQCP
jgi:hypothetical protein